MTKFVKTGCDKNGLQNCLTETVRQGIPVVDGNLELPASSEAAQFLLTLPGCAVGPNLDAYAAEMRHSNMLIGKKSEEVGRISFRQPATCNAPDAQVRLVA